MRSLKNHLSLIFPLFSIFFAIEFYMILNRVVTNYEKTLTNDYTILIVSKNELTIDKIKPYIDILNLKEIDSNLIIDRLKKDKIDLDFDALKTFLPKFYEIKLNHFPSSNELKNIKEKLSSIDGINRVETFSKSHSKIYDLLLFIKKILNFFIIIIGVLSFMLILKQIKVWYLEHKDRMYIMELFGAPLWMRSGVLIKIAIIDTILSILFVDAIFYYFSNLKILQNWINFHLDLFVLLKDSSILLIVGILISFYSITSITLRQEQK